MGQINGASNIWGAAAALTHMAATAVAAASVVGADMLACRRPPLKEITRTYTQIQAAFFTSWVCPDGTITKDSAIGLSCNGVQWHSSGYYDIKWQLQVQVRSNRVWATKDRHAGRHGITEPVTRH